VKTSQTQKLNDYFYKIEFVGNGVRVSSPGGSFSKLMSYASFMTFTMDKELRPYSATEYESLTAQKKEAGVHRTGHWTDNLISPAVLIQAVKKFPEAFRYKLQQQQKYEAARLFAGFASVIPDGFNVLYGADIKADAISELDSSITQVIE
jgi:hypothetical protein